MLLTILIPKSPSSAGRPAFCALVTQVHRLVSFTPLPLYPHCPQTTNPCRSQSRFRRSAEEKVLLFVRQLEPGAAGCQQCGHCAGPVQRAAVDRSITTVTLLSR
jgi:hypothetical protein